MNTLSDRRKSWVRRNSPALILLLAVVVLYPIAIYKILFLSSLILGDINLWPGPDTFYRGLISAWQDTNNGGTAGAPSKFAVLLVVIFRQSFAPKLFLLSLLPAAGLSMFLASRLITKSLLARYVAVLVYTINPVTLGEFTSASPLLLIYALMPLELYFFLRLALSPKINLQHLFAFSAVTAFSFSFLQDAVLMYLLLLLPTAILSAVARPGKSLEILKHIVEAMVLSALVSLALVLPEVAFRFRGAVALESAGKGVIGGMLADVRYTYLPSYALNVLRLAGNAGTGMWALGYNNPGFLWTWAGYVIPFLVGFSLIRATRQPRVNYLLCLGFAIAALAVLGFVMATQEALTYQIFERYPVLFAFRNPRRLMFIAALMFSLLLAAGVDSLQSVLRRLSLSGTHKKARSLVHYVSLAGLILLLLIYAWPVFAGDLGMEYVHPGYRGWIEVPPYYFDIANQIKSLSLGQHRTLWLPMHLTPQSIVTGLDVNAFLIPSGTYFDPADTTLKFYSAMLTALIHNETKDWGRWLSAADIKYVVIDKGSVQRGPPALTFAWNTLYPTGDPLAYRELVAVQRDLKLVFENDQSAIFENTDAADMIALYDMSALGYVTGLDPVRAYQHRLSDRNLTVVSGRTEITIDGKSDRDLLLILFFNYDEGWQVTRDIARHLRAFGWANGFVIKQGNVHAVISFAYQNIFIATSFVSYFSWLVVTVYLIATITHGQLRLRHFAKKPVGC